MKTIETKRLQVRAFREDDFAAVHSYTSKKENTIYMPWGPNDEEETKAFIESATGLDETKHSYDLACVNKETGLLIGGCHLSLLSPDEAEIGWILHRDYWKQGYGTEIGRALLELGFDILNLRRLVAHCDLENTASFKLMEKIGMRREGLFLDGRKACKLSNRSYGDDLAYAMLKDEWDVSKEISYYKSLPVVFNGFIEIPNLSDGDIHLVCIKKSPADPVRKFVPAYHFAICKGSEQIGQIDLRIGYTDGLYYGGNIGYAVEEKHRGNGYAVKACRLIMRVAKAHGMTKILITNNHTNYASQRVCEKLGAKLVRVARLPEWSDLYKEGQRFENIFEADAGKV